MVRGFSIPELTLEFLLVLLGALLGAYVAFYLFRFNVGRRMERSVKEIKDALSELQIGLDSLSRNLNAQAPAARDRLKLNLPTLFESQNRDPGTAGRLSPDKAPPAASDKIVVEAFRRRREPDPSGSQAQRKCQLESLLKLYATDSDAFQSEVTAKAVSVRKVGPGPGAVANVYEHPNGRFWLFAADGKEWVVPKPGLRIDDTSYYDTGIRELFESPGYESNQAFSFKVIRPAAVVRAGDSWTLGDRGRLELRAEANA